MELNLLFCTPPRESAMEENMPKINGLKQAFIIFYGTVGRLDDSWVA